MTLFSVGAFLEFVMSSVLVTGPPFDLLKPRFGKYVLYAVLMLSASLLASVMIWPVDILGVVAGVPGPAMTYQQWFQSSIVYGIYFAVSAFAVVPRDITQVLNTAGGILVVGGGVLGILGIPDGFLYFEFIGIVIFYVGFVMSSRFAFRTMPTPNPAGMILPSATT
jgi:hypothetical protein